VLELVPEKFRSGYEIYLIPLYTQARKSVRELNTVTPVTEAHQPDERCPKRMTFGPCGAVTLEGGCEIDGVTCPFVNTPLRSWDGATPTNTEITPAGRAFLNTLEHRPVIVTDMPGIALDANSIQPIADVLAGTADAVLLGDHNDARVQFPPAYRAMLVRSAGLEPWVGLNCRDRNRVALEGELAALRHANVTGVHCITGDHPKSGHRPDALPVFDFDSTQLAALARANGVLVSVAASPCSVPVLERPRRLAQKVLAGAHIAFVNHSGPGECVLEFVQATQLLGANVPFIAGLAVITSEAGARMIQKFHNLVLPPGYLEGIMTASDVRRAGIQAAIRFGHDLLSQPGVRGLNLSSVPEPGQELTMAQDLAEIARAFL
jgi:methylenetetrahydrofolate reductase (NADPH)